MLRAKRSHRGSTGDRASVDTTSSSTSAGPYSRPKRLKTENTHAKRSVSEIPVNNTFPASLCLRLQETYGFRWYEIKFESVILLFQAPPSPNSADLIEEIFTAVVTHQDEFGSTISSDFSILPSRKEFPDYYDMIKRPIDLKQIAMKIQGNSYRGLDQIVDDLILMADNAIRYNMPKSGIHNVRSNTSLI